MTEKQTSTSFTIIWSILLPAGNCNNFPSFCYGATRFAALLIQTEEYPLYTT